MTAAQSSAALDQLRQDVLIEIRAVRTDVSDFRNEARSSYANKEATDVRFTNMESAIAELKAIDKVRVDDTAANRRARSAAYLTMGAAALTGIFELLASMH